MSLSGTQFAARLIGLMGEAREEEIIDAVFRGEMPEYLKSGWPSLETPAVISGKVRKLRYSFMPEWLSVGNSEDAFFTPEWPSYAGALAEVFGCLLPSTRIVEQITANAVVRIPLQIPPLARPVSPKMETTAAWIQVNEQIRNELHRQVNYRPGVSIAGAKKDVVTGPGLDGSEVAIFGGLKDDLRSFWQPYSTIHPSNYSDYSHGIRLVFRGAELDNQPIDLVDVFQDPSLHILVSSQGPFNPIFSACQDSKPRTPETEFRIGSKHRTTRLAYQLAEAWRCGSSRICNLQARKETFFMIDLWTALALQTAIAMPGIWALHYLERHEQKRQWQKIRRTETRYRRTRALLNKAERTQRPIEIAGRAFKVIGADWYERVADEWVLGGAVS